MDVATEKPQVLLRMQPEVKEALKKAAADDDRSVAIFVERLIAEWLRERGYLPPKEPKK